MFSTTASHRLARLTLPVSLALLLSACGGGGGDDEEQAAAPCEAQRAAVVARYGAPQQVDDNSASRVVAYTYWTMGYKATFTWTAEGVCSVQQSEFPPAKCNLADPACKP